MRLFRKGGLLSVVLGLALLFALLALGITQETPMGSISGSVRMAESGLALPNSAIVVSPVSVTEESPKPRVVFSDKQGAFQLSALPAGDYKIEASAKAHELTPTRIAVREGSVTTLDLELQPKDPELRLYSSQRVFMPGEVAQVEAHGFGPEKSLAIKVYRVDLDRFLKAGSFFAVLYSLSDNYYYEGKRPDPSQVGKLVESSEHRIQNADAEGSFTDVVDLNKLPDGFYWVSCKMGALTRGAFISVSKIALVTKSSPGEVLCFVTDLKTGQALPGVPLSINEGGKFVSIGKTDGNGLTSIKIKDDGRKVLVLASQGSSQAVSGFPASEAGASTDGSITIFSYTDRPIYRPGDDVQFKGFARKRIGSDYTLPGAGKVECEVTDVDGNLVKQFSLSLNANGSFAGHFQTTEESGPGDYSFSFKTLGTQSTLGFTLAAYRKPEFTVKVQWSKPRYAMGERLRATVKTEYYFGGPVAGAKVTASLYRSQAWIPDGEDAEYYEDEYAYEEAGGVSGDYLEQQEGVTDANGEAVFEFRTKPDEKEDADYPADYQYTLSADVAEAGDKYFSGTGSVYVTQGDFRLSVDTDRYIVAPGESVDATITTKRFENDESVPNQPVSLVYGIQRWTGNQEAFGQLGRLEVTTGADGTAHVKIPASQAGSMLLRASANDAMGNNVKAREYLWVGTDSFGYDPASGDLSIKLDKKLYSPGETCKALITTAKTGGTALVTVEADKVLYAKTVQINGQSALVTIPVDRAYLPRVTVAVTLIQDKKFMQGSETLKIDVSARRLNLKVTSDQAQYLPGATATYSIHAATPDGKPAAADLSLAVVDEAIYAIREASIDPIRDFYPARYNRVQTNYSFPELYLDGGDKGGDSPVRMNFKDTAAWIPSVRTDSQGNASVQVKLPDNLTSWRATVVGVSDATDVGVTTGNVVVAKPLMIRLQGPKFMVKGDHQDVAAIVTNRTGSDASVHIALQTGNFSTRDSLNRTITVRNGVSESVSWDMSAQSAGASNLVARAWIDRGASDGVQQTVEIQPHARELNSVDAGEIHGTASVSLALREDADTDVGRAVITLSPTIGTSLYQALDELIGYPYGCVEQTMSRFMPALVVSQSLKQVGRLRPDLEKKLPDIATQSIARLKNMQHYDGGWGWWETDRSEPFMTAYVLDGLRRAKGLGYTVSPFMTDKAVQWSVDQSKTVEAKKWATRDRLYLAYMLALYGKPSEAKAMLAATKLENASPASIATAALAYDALGSDFTSQRDALIQQLRDTAIVGSTTAQWTVNDGNKYWWDYENIYGAETTALPLMAIEAVAPDDPLVGKAVRHLLATRRGDWWWSTRDTSFALLAVAPVLKREDAMLGSASVDVLVNGRALKTIRFNPQDAMGVNPSLTLPLKELNRGANTVEFRATGAKTLYYTVDLKQFAQAEQLGRLINGSEFTLERSYHLLESERMEDGTFRLKPSKQTVSRVHSGDIIQVELKLTSEHPRTYLMLEDPLPSNCHVADDRGDVDINEWSDWYSSKQVFDNRVAFFARYVPAGTQTFTYIMRAESPGLSRALPPVAQNMYNTEDRTSDAESPLEVIR